MRHEELNLFEREVEELILEINSRYGYDFSGYSRASVYRRIKRFLTNKNLDSLGALKQKVFSDPYFF